MEPKCEHCGKPLSYQDEFCPHCKKPQKNVLDLSKSGEVLLRQFEVNSESIMNEISALRLIFNKLLDMFKETMNSIKDPKKIIIPIVLSVVWLLSSLLPRLGITNSLIRLISYLSFAEGGISSSFQSVIGGLIGKGLVAYFYTTLFDFKHNSIKPLLSGLKNFLSVLSTIKHDIPTLVFGSGISFLLSNFFMGSVDSSKSMILWVCFIISISSSQSNGFLTQLLTSIKGLDAQTVNRGLSFGFLISIGMSQTNIPFILYVLGIGLIILSLVLHFLPIKSKEVTV